MGSEGFWGIISFFELVAADRLLHSLSLLLGSYFCSRMGIFLQVLFLLQLSSLGKQEKDN